MSAITVEPEMPGTVQYEDFPEPDASVRDQHCRPGASSRQDGHGSSA